jgi:hypothetical protein
MTLQGQHFTRWQREALRHHKARMQQRSTELSLRAVALALAAAEEPHLSRHRRLEAAQRAAGIGAGGRQRSRVGGIVRPARRRGTARANAARQLSCRRAFVRMAARSAGSWRCPRLTAPAGLGHPPQHVDDSAVRELIQQRSRIEEMRALPETQQSAAEVACSTAGVRRSAALLPAMPRHFRRAGISSLVMASGKSPCPRPALWQHLSSQRIRKSRNIGWQVPREPKHPSRSGRRSSSQGASSGAAPCP